MAWEIIIGEGGLAVTVDDDASLTITDDQVLAGDGSTDFFDKTILIVGDVRKALPGDVADRIFELEALQESGLATRVQLKQNGILKKDYIPADFVGTPKVTRFRTHPDSGAGDSHWPFQLEILIRSGSPDTGLGGGAVSGTRQIITEFFGKAFVRKTWIISVTGKTRAQANAIVRQKRPSISPLRETIVQDKNNTATATYVYQAAKGRVILFQENTTFKPGGPRFVEDLQTENNDPVLHRARRRPGIMRITGVIQAVAQANGQAPNINPPAPHLLADDQTIFRVAPESESPVVPDLVDPVQGIYQLNFEEIYWITFDTGFDPALPGGTVPVPDHSGHDRPFRLTAPPDGNFFD